MSLKSDWRSLDYTQQMIKDCKELIESVKETWADGGYVGDSVEEAVILGRIQGIRAVLDWVEEAPEEEEEDA